MDEYTEEHGGEEILPFAMMAAPKNGQTTKPLAMQQQQQHHVLPTKYCGEVSNLSSLGGSTVTTSCPSESSSSSGESRASSSSYSSSTGGEGFAPSSSLLLQTHDSDYLNTAASLLQQQQDSSFLGGGMSSNLTQEHLMASTRSVSQSAMIRQQQQRLPALPEDTPLASTTAAGSLLLPPPSESPSPQQHHTENRNNGSWFTRPSSNDLFGNFWNPSQTIIPASLSSSSQLQQQSGIQQEERRLASLAGATATLTGPESFQVSVDIAMPQISFTNAMDIVGSPDLLHLWLDSIEESLVITKTSEGARNSTNDTQGRAATPETNREYEGEWMEGTTTHLVSPRNASGYVYGVSRAIGAALGFPSYGRIAMFVERPKGQVSIDIGPFDGGIEVHHRLKVSQIYSEPQQQPKIRIVDDVRLQHSAGGRCDEMATFCQLFASFERCLLPSVNDFMDQVLSSMARLRFVVENNKNGKEAPLSAIYPRPAQDGNSLAFPLLEQTPRA